MRQYVIDPTYSVKKGLLEGLSDSYGRRARFKNVNRKGLGGWSRVISPQAKVTRVERKGIL